MLIGTSQYASPELDDLPAVRNNLNDLAAVLTGQTGLPPGNCTVLSDTTDVEYLGHHLETVAAQADDLLLVYYAGHGLLDAKGKLYLTMPRTQQDRLRWTGLPYSHIHEVVHDSPAANRVVILDCCFAGRAIGVMSDPLSVVSGQIEIAGTYTLTSTSANTVSHAPIGARHTAFTGHLLDVLTSGSEDPVPLLTMHTIYRSLLRSLAAHGLPRPEQRGTLTADQLALVPNRTAGVSAARDALLAEYAGTGLTPAAVLDKSFDKAAFGAQGYNEDEVDYFLDLVEADLGMPIDETPTLTPADVQNAAFHKPATGTRGYDEFQVDEFLDLVQAEIARRADLRARYQALG